jgi:hypothetical protein
VVDLSEEPVAYTRVRIQTPEQTIIAVEEALATNPAVTQAAAEAVSATVETLGILIVCVQPTGGIYPPRPNVPNGHVEWVGESVPPDAQPKDRWIEL